MMSGTNLLIGTLFFISLGLGAETYQWNKTSYQLPFPRTWFVKKKRENPKDPLVFMDIETPKPRIVAKLYGTNFDVSSSSLSDFKKRFLSAKEEWMKKNSATLKQKMVTSFDEKTQTFTYSFGFTTSYGVFEEKGKFSKCSPLLSVAVKIMTPKVRKERADQLKLEDKIDSLNLCPK